MIEQIMYFVLGVLIAALVALLVLPAVWHRAVRLTTRRVEAAVPVSMFEIQADKDQQRAFFALNQRRLELQIDAMRDTVVAHAATIETQRRRIFELEQSLAALTERRELLEATGAERDVMLGEVQDQLADGKAALERLEREAGERRSELLARRTDLEQEKARAELLATTLTVREEALAAQRERISTLEAENARLAAELASAAGRLDEAARALATSRAAAEEAGSAAAAAAADLSARIGALETDLTGKTTLSAARAQAIAALEAERDRLAADLALAHRDLEAARAVLQAFEQRRAAEYAAAETEARRSSEALHMLRADHALMQGALAKARGADQNPGADASASRDAMKAELADIAARFVAYAAQQEGAGSPLRQLSAEPASANGATPLAGRIRALLDAEEPRTAEAPPAQRHPAQAAPVRIASI